MKDPCDMEQLQEHYENEAKDYEIKSLIQLRTIEAAGLHFDFSKNLISDQTMDLLLQLAQKKNLEDQREAMFRGEHINFTENRAVLHTALRAAPFNSSWCAKLFDFQSPLVMEQLQRMKLLTERVHDGSWRGSTNKRIRHVVNIGIGGSDLGPCMAVMALEAAYRPTLIDDNGCSYRIKSHFVSNVDESHLASVIAEIESQQAIDQTLFVIVSKTFTTAETMLNASSAASILLKAMDVSDADLDRKKKVMAAHFVAVSTNTEAVSAFGISSDAIVSFWDWVGGRYSLWSAVGLSIMLAIGYDNFLDLLKGAHHMDQHFYEADLKQNMPVIMALLGVWYTNFFGSVAHAIIPYEQLLARFPAYLQQADMESNGKSARRTSTNANEKQLLWSKTGPVIFGEPGTNGQHAFFQLLHQGTHLIPVDFIVGRHPAMDSTDLISMELLSSHHQMLMANCIAQSEALMLGGVMGSDPNNVHRQFPGNRPSNVIVYDRLCPFILGSLIALYEHKIFVQGVIWDINSFDQWGVELGKQLANVINKELDPNSIMSAHDPSTLSLIQSCRQ